MKYQAYRFKYKPADIAPMVLDVDQSPLVTSSNVAHTGNVWFAGVGGGSSVIVGTNAREQFFGSQGNDTLSGGGGGDWLQGGQGNDVMTGGAGNDMFVFRRGDGPNPTTRGDGDDIITDFSAGDVLRFRGFSSKEVSTHLVDGGLMVDYGGIGGQGDGNGSILLLGVTSLSADAFSFG